MRRIISNASGHIYIHAIKPLLFKRTPDEVHEKMLVIGSRIMRLPIAKHLPKTIAYQNKSYLSQNLLGIYFPNPVGLSAGLDKNAEIVKLTRAIGFGFGTVGSITASVCEGNPKPWYYRLPKSKSLVVYAGLANHGVEQTAKRLKSYKLKSITDYPIVANIAKTNSPEASTEKDAILDYVASLKQLANEKRIRVFEINISCPSTYGGEPFTTPERLDNLLSYIDALELTKSVWIKMPINLAWTEFESLLRVIVTHKVDAVTIGNLNKNRTSIPYEELPAHIMGSLSGKPTQELSDSLIARTYSLYGKKLMIIGVGGIFSAKDAYRKICLGASLVELVTGLIFEGPQLIGQINREIVKLLKADGFDNISQAIGSKNRHT